MYNRYFIVINIIFIVFWFNVIYLTVTRMTNAHHKNIYQVSGPCCICVIYVIWYNLSYVVYKFDTSFCVTFTWNGLFSYLYLHVKKNHYCIFMRLVCIYGYLLLEQKVIGRKTMAIILINKSLVNVDKTFIILCTKIEYKFCTHII